MPIREIIYAIRVIRTVGYAADRFPQELARKRLVRAQKQAKKVAYEAEISREQTALRFYINSHKLTTVEVTNGIAYFIARGSNFAEANRKFRLSLENGSRQPGDREDCVLPGRLLRRDLQLLTDGDQSYFARAEKRKMISDARYFGLMFLAIALFLAALMLIAVFEGFHQRDGSFQGDLLFGCVVTSSLVCLLLLLSAVFLRSYRVQREALQQSCAEDIV